MRMFMIFPYFSEGRSSFKQTTPYCKVFLLVKDIILGYGAIHGHTTCTSMYVNVALKVISLIWSSGYHRVPQHIRALPPSWYHGHLEALATSLAAPTKSNWMQLLQHLVYHHLPSFIINVIPCYPYAKSHLRSKHVIIPCYAPFHPCSDTPKFTTPCNTLQANLSSWGRSSLTIEDTPSTGKTSRKSHEWIRMARHWHVFHRIPMLTNSVQQIQSAANGLSIFEFLAGPAHRIGRICRVCEVAKWATCHLRHSYDSYSGNIYHLQHS